MKILLSWFATQEEVYRFKRVLPPGGEVLVPKMRRHYSRYEVDFADLEELAPQAEVILGWVMPDGILELATSLKAIIWFRAGCDDLDLEQIERRGIVVANSKGANSVAVAEYTLAFMLGLAKKVVQNHTDVLNAHREAPGTGATRRGVMLEGKTLLLMGLGKIGKAVAKRAKAFDMEVIAIRRNPDKGTEGVADEVFGPGDLKAQIGRADFAVLAAPITSENRGSAVFDAEMIGAMKSSAFLINVARGNLVDELALYEALKSDSLAGYGTDCWWMYTSGIPATYHFPTPSRTGVQHLPNVLGAGAQAAGGIWEIFDNDIQEYAAESLTSFVRGEKMAREIDLKLGY